MKDKVVKHKWVVSWIYNDINHNEGYKKLTEAVKKMRQLEELGIESSLHNTGSD